MAMNEADIQLVARIADAAAAPEIAGPSGLDGRKQPAADVNTQDSREIVRAARQYQHNQRQVGITVSNSEAVMHVTRSRNS